MGHFRKSRGGGREHFDGQHRFEHWYRDNTVYFITARCKGKFPAFATEEAKAIFWDRFGYYTRQYGFTPWATSLLDNHYHTVGYLRRGEELGEMMRKLHGSVAKLANDLLEVRLLPFWYDSGKQGYFDGCLRNERQGRLTYRYVYTKCIRHKIAPDPKLYPHTRVNIELEAAIRRALELNAFMTGVSYPRYSRKRRD